MPAAGGFGIEEEYLLLDLHSGRLLDEPSAAVLAVCREVLGAQFAEEMFRCQIELASPVFTRQAQARDYLGHCRGELARRLAAEGAGLLTAGTHPAGAWRSQRPTASVHYRQLFEDYRQVARRSLVCGLHVHVGVPPEVDRMAVINRIRHWLPMLLMLSTSSPFWEGEDSGYYSYRRVLCGEWPRMGLPEPLADWAAYQRYLAWLQDSGAVPAGGDCWWALRPSRRFPTVEVRIADACPRLEDGLCIAGVFRQMVDWAVRQHGAVSPPDAEAGWREQENYWRAMRSGRRGQYLVDDGGVCSAAQWLARIGDILQPDSEDAVAALDRAASILHVGSSADRQLARFDLARQSGASRAQALRQVLDGLLSETRGEPVGAGLPARRQ